MDAGGNERSQLFLLEDGRVTDLTRMPEAIHYSGGFSPDGSRVAYTATRRNGTDFDVFVQDLGPMGTPEAAESPRPSGSRAATTRRRLVPRRPRP
jgi:Tol biopolymer transport system component